MSDELNHNHSADEETPEGMINDIVKKTTGKDRYISSTSTAEQNAIAEARKKKIAGFKLNIDLNSMGEIPSAPLIPPADDIKREPIKKTEAPIEADLAAVEKLQKEEKKAPVIDKPKVTPETVAEPENISSFSGEEQRIKMNREEKQLLKKYKKTEKRRQREKAEKNGCLFRLVWVAMVVVMAVVLGMFFMRGSNDMLAVTRQQQEKETISVNIPENATIDQVAKILADNGVINEEMFFKAYATVTKSTSGFKSGEMDIENNLDYEAIVNLLKYGRELKETVSLQFQEGMSVMEIGKLLEENKVCKEDDFLEACNSDVFDEDYDFIAAIDNTGDRYYKLEGYLFPDTYEFYLGESGERAARRFLDNFEKKVINTQKKYSGYDKEMSISEYAALNGKTLDEVIKMGSLIQAEAANDQDMYYISSIFYNRLSTIKNGGISPYGDYDLDKLKSDATLYYPYSSEEDIPDNLKDSFTSSYNTYKISGLPAGAICNPGVKAIDAAINPMNTGYYYFCHKSATESSSAEAYYAYTYSEHLKNLKTAGLDTGE